MTEKKTLWGDSLEYFNIVEQHKHSTKTLRRRQPP